jgi:anaerobic selenocysteine-containing dehydrogenase
MRKLQDTAVFQSVCQECYMGDGVLVYVKNGAILITIDPRNISVAKQADVWLQVRPGADCALALGMIKVMIEEKRIGYNEFPLWSGIKAPISACHNELAIKAMHTGKPYPIKALINHGTNLLTQFPEPRTVYKALKQLD